MNAALRRATERRPVRFLIVGGGAAALLFVLSFAFVRLGLAPFAASVIAYAIAFVVAYTAQRGWTFGATHPHSHALPRYLTVQAATALFSGLVAHVTVNRFGWPELAMSAALTIAASAASYVLTSLWVFPQGRAPRDA